MTDFEQLYKLTLREWNILIEGYQYRQIDKKRMMVEEAWLFAAANNGKKLNSYVRSLDVQEKKIGKSEEELKVDKEYKKALYNRKKAATKVYLQRIREQKARGEIDLLEKEAKKDEQKLRGEDNGGYP